MKRLNIGCGNMPIEGFTNIDKYYYPGSKWELTNHALAKEWEEGRYIGKWIYGDAIDLKFEDKSFDRIVMSHVLEHLSMEEANIAIKEAFRVCKDEGYIEVEVPDMAKACKRFDKVEYVEDKDNSQWYEVMGMIYGTTGKDGEGQFHHSGYDKKFLKYKLEERGFRRIRSMKTTHAPHTSFRLKGYKC